MRIGEGQWHICMQLLRFQFVILLKLSKNKQGYAEVSVSTNMDTAST